MSTKRLSNLFSLPWKVAAPLLQNALGGYDPSAEVEKGLAFPFYIGEPNHGACILVRVEKSEMVVIAFEGVNKLKDANKVILELAKAIKAKTIRVHTQRKGQKRYFNRLGLPFELAETRETEQVLRMVI